MMNQQLLSAALIVLLTHTVTVSAGFRSFAGSESDPVKWLSLGDAQELAVTEDKIVFVFVEASWCAVCKRMRNEVFTDPEIHLLMKERYLPVSIDVEDDGPVTFNGEEFTERSFARALQVTGTPTTIFLDKTGVVVGSQPGFVDAGRFETLLRHVDSYSRGRISFETFMEGQTN